MEKNLVSMAREIEKLRAEKLNAERRDRGPSLSLPFTSILIFLLLSSQTVASENAFALFV